MFKDGYVKYLLGTQDDITQFEIQEGDREIHAELDAYLNQLPDRVRKMAKVSLINFFQDYSKSSCDREYIGELRAGDVAYVDFGAFNREREISFSHMAIVLQVGLGKFWCIPVTSAGENFRQAYHPFRNRRGNKSMYQLYPSDPDTYFLKHHSVAKVTDIKCLNIGRVIEVKNCIDVNSPVFKNIKKLAELVMTYGDSIKYRDISKQMEVRKR